MYNFQLCVQEMILKDCENYLEIKASKISDGRLNIGKMIKKYIRFGVKPCGKLRLYISEIEEDYDCTRFYYVISMEADFFSLLHACRAGLRIERPQESCYPERLSDPFLAGLMKRAVSYIKRLLGGVSK